MSRERFVWTRFARESSASRKSALDRVATSGFEDSPAIRYHCRPVSRIVAARSLSSSLAYSLARQRSSMGRSPRDPSIIPARPIVRFGSDSLDSIKDQPAEKLQERRRRRRRRRVTTAINEHTERPGCLDLRADKNHSRKLDDPRAATPKFPRFEAFARDRRRVIINSESFGCCAEGSRTPLPFEFSLSLSLSRTRHASSACRN